MPLRRLKKDRKSQQKIAKTGTKQTYFQQQQLKTQNKKNVNMPAPANDKTEDERIDTCLSSFEKIMS